MGCRLWGELELIYSVVVARICETLRGEWPSTAYPDHPLHSRWSVDSNCLRLRILIAIPRSHPLPSCIFGIHGGEQVHRKRRIRWRFYRLHGCYEDRVSLFSLSRLDLPHLIYTGLHACAARGSKSMTSVRQTSTAGRMTARPKPKRLRLMENASGKKTIHRIRQLLPPRPLRGKKAPSSLGNSHESCSCRTLPFRTVHWQRDDRIHLHHLLRCDNGRCLWWTIVLTRGCHRLWRNQYRQGR